MKKTVKNSTVSKRGRVGEGRPRAVIPYDECKKLAMMQCTQDEISAFTEISVDVLAADEKFMQIYRDGLAHGRISVRRSQFTAMQAGNQTMLVWLGKQYLGQRDSHEFTGANGAPLIPEIHDDLELARRAAYMLTLQAIDKAKKEDPSHA